MPINASKAVESIRFGYSNEIDGSYELDIEFHYSDQFGPTVTVHNLETPISLPASLFTDVVDFSRARRSIAAPEVNAPVARVGNLGTASKLSPTRVNNVSSAVQQPSPINNRAAEIQQYGSQISVLAGGAVDRAAAKPKPQAPQRPPEPENPVSDEDALALSLEAGRKRKEQGSKPKKVIKKVGEE